MTPKDSRETRDVDVLASEPIHPGDPIAHGRRWRAERDQAHAVLRVLAVNLPAFADALAKQDHPAPCGADPCVYCWVEGMLADAAQDIAEVLP